MLFEKVKSFFSKQKAPEPTSFVNKDNVLNDFNTDSTKIYGTMFDDRSLNKTFNIFYNQENETLTFDSLIRAQAEKIKLYRSLSSEVEVSKAIDEIVNELIFVYDDVMPLKITVNEDNEKIKEAITKSFEKILNMMSIKTSIFDLVKRSYIDGQLILHCTYNKKNLKNGITSINMIDPCYFYYNQKELCYKYLYNDVNQNIYLSCNIPNDETYSDEEIVRIDFGLYKERLNLSYLENAIKPANQLKLLEDMLIPLRFSRSISRRVFNVDIGDLPQKRGAEVMKEIIEKFKYKKFYDTKTGEITNQSHVTSMVEDYWFANRSGGKGTTVEMLDETGNLGEINDILYFTKKLYRALNIPSSRIDTNPEADASFDYTTTQTTKEDLSFFMFISRLRKVYIEAFRELLKRELLSTGILSNEDWATFKNKINIVFTNENIFVERMKLEIYNYKTDIYNNLQNQQGKIMPVNELIQLVYGFTDEQIEENLKKIEQEKTNPLYKSFYEQQTEEY